MSVADIARSPGTKTPIEKASAAKWIDEFEYIEPAMTTAVEQSLLDRLLSPHSSHEATQCAIVMAYHPIAAPTSPAFHGEIMTFANAYWLTTALAKPLATVTIASFEAPFRCPPPSSPWGELLNHFVSRAAPQLELDSGAPLVMEAGPELLLERGPELVLQPGGGETRAYSTFVELADWLELTQARTAALLGMGRTTPLAWKRNGHEPQPARARRLYQTHALVSTLLRRLGREEMRRWMDSGNPSPLDLIAEGDVTGADDLADELIFGTAPSRERVSAWVDEPIDTHAPAAEPTQGQPRRVRRRPPRRRTR